MQREAVRMRPSGRAPHRGAMLAGLAALLLSGCAVGPKYVRPTAEVPPAYKESPNWKLAQPNDEFSRGSWWEIYSDSQLDSLEQQINVSNQTLKAQQAQFLEARAAVMVARSRFYPDVTASPAGSRN